MVEEEVLSVRKQLEKISSGEADNAQVRADLCEGQPFFFVN